MSRIKRINRRSHPTIKTVGFLACCRKAELLAKFIFKYLKLNPEDFSHSYFFKWNRRGKFFIRNVLKIIESDNLVQKVFRELTHLLNNQEESIINQLLPDHYQDYLQNKREILNLIQ